MIKKLALATALVFGISTVAPSAEAASAMQYGFIAAAIGVVVISVVSGIGTAIDSSTIYTDIQSVATTNGDVYAAEP